MERIELAVAGLQQALRPRSARGEIPRIDPPTSHQEPGPAWLQLVRQQLPLLLSGLSSEHTGTSTAMAARSRRLHAERNRLVARVQGVLPLLDPASGAVGTSWEALQGSLLRLVRDIGHHHQRVNDLLYDESWLDVGGSE